jgi:hypothetical protein
MSKKGNSHKVDVVFVLFVGLVLGTLCGARIFNVPPLSTFGLLDLKGCVVHFDASLELCF